MGRILVVDDDPQLVDLVAVSLERDGYCVQRKADCGPEVAPADCHRVILSTRLADDRNSDVDGDLFLDRHRRTATLAGRDLRLTGREFELLSFLLHHPGIAHTREQLLEQVWRSVLFDASTVTVHIRRLRLKLGDGASRVGTVWGVGYCYRGEAMSSASITVP